MWCPLLTLRICFCRNRQVLERLSRRRDDFFVAIISGRAVSNVREMAGIEGITYGGNHGLEIQHADGMAYIHPLPEKDKENLTKVKKELQEQVCTNVECM